MKIAVIAADGRSGQMFTSMALDSGHAVNAGIYNNNPFDHHEKLQAIQCNALVPNEVGRLIKGCEAVVSLIGHSKKSPSDVQTRAIKVVINEMKDTKCRRLVSLTGTGVRMEEDDIRLTDKILNLSLKLVDSDRIQDGINHYNAIKESGVDWTILRVLKLQNTKPGDYSLKENGPAKLIVSRHEVASAILDILEKDLFIQKLPIVAPKNH